MTVDQYVGMALLFLAICLQAWGAPKNRRER